MASLCVNHVSVHLLRRLVLLLAVLLGSGCTVRWTSMVESIAFYHPTRGKFSTPTGIEDVTFHTAGGAELHGWWLPAVGTVPHAGTILFCHGNAGALPEHVDFVDDLPAMGFDVLMFDYRGYGRSTKKGGLHRRMLLRDAEAAVAYLRQRVGPEGAGRLYLLGHSMGAVMAANLAAGLNSRGEMPFAAVALVAPFSSFPRVASDFAGPLGWALIPKGLATEQAVTTLEGVPLLIVHGGRDNIVRPYHGERVTERARAAGMDVQLLRVPEADHIDVFEPQFGAVRAIAEFFAVPTTPGVAPTTSAATVPGPSHPPE
jgi:hypothetical protein